MRPMSTAPRDGTMFLVADGGPVLKPAYRHSTVDAGGKVLDGGGWIFPYCHPYDATRVGGGPGSQYNRDADTPSHWCWAPMPEVYTEDDASRLAARLLGVPNPPVMRAPLSHYMDIAREALMAFGVTRDERITGLIEANNEEVERRRAAERKLAQLVELIAFNYSPWGATKAARWESMGYRPGGYSEENVMKALAKVAGIKIDG